MAIVGRRRDASEFDLEDARIVSLGLHHDVDSLLGDTIDIDLRWRLLARTRKPRRWITIFPRRNR